AVAQLAAATAILNPLGLIPDRPPTTGAWGDPERLAAARAIVAPDRRYLAEDAGLLVASAARPVVDDLFLWSRLVARDVVDPAPILAQVREGRFAAVLSEADLERLAAAPAFGRARWAPALVAAVLERYRFARCVGGEDCRGATLFLYEPR
ncbi:MAG: hypothetical protein ACRDF0_06580, partial [Candidatus Limnocylindria bacterium]